ncbi:hypothetical protein BJX76DRAFT_323312, partial [Aspergillus varians]
MFYILCSLDLPATIAASSNSLPARYCHWLQELYSPPFGSEHCPLMPGRNLFAY